MKGSLVFFIFLSLLVGYIQFPVDAAPPAGPLIKHVTSLIKWTRASSKLPQSDGNVVQFEEGYLVETVARGNDLGGMPYKIRVSQEGELFAVDEDKSNIVKITPPLSQYSRSRLVAGSFQGYTGHVDGKPSEARFSHPRGVTMDDKGNVYVADTTNLAIRKIGDSGVTTIAGGKSNVAGYRDGPSEDAKFSNDFDVIYVRSTCSLLVIDRGNAALRQIALDQEDCDYQDNSVSVTDILMVIGAIVIGYVSSLLQQGYGSAFFSRMEYPLQKKNLQIPGMDPKKDEQEAVWPSFSQLLVDLSKLAFEFLGGILVYLTPFRYKPNSSRNGLTPLQDSLIMPEDEPEPEPQPKVQTVQKHRAPALMSETRHTYASPIITDKFLEVKPPKMRSSSMKDPSLSTKHKSLRRHEYAEYYASGEVPVRSKSQKERKHRHRDKTGETMASSGTESKGIESKTVNYGDSKFDPYTLRTKYGDGFRFD